MGFVLEIGVHIRKSGRICYRSLLHHPVLTTLLVFLIFLYIFFPFAFSLLVTASPVLVCSVILLGTLLIFGQPDLPKTERENKITHDFASVRTRVSADETVSLDMIEKFSIDKFQRKGIDKVSCSRCNSDPEGSIGYMPLVDDTFHYTDSERRELDSKELENQRVIRKEKLGIDGITRDVKSIEKPASLKGDNSESSQGGGGGDDEATSSGSNRAESTSPDASIVDILPILDELHPLLDLDAPLLVHISPDDSGLDSDRSNDGSNESDDEDTEIRSRGVQQYGVDDNDGDEEAHDGKEDDSKSAIKWTKDDQMNLRDLGNLELERNRCLEKVLTMRRASKIDEKNLIDLDTSENPFNVTQISITTQNPFDLSHDSYDDMGLPPIPGSAPSTYLPRRNPFDLLYEPNEENPEIKEDHVEQEDAIVLPTNTVFCRHQSIRPSRLGDAKQERQDLKWRPVFVPEQLASEGTIYSSFQGLPRDSSDSKLSSIPDTESASSGDDLDERKFSERVKKAEVISNIYQGSHLVNHRSPSLDDLDPLEMERPGEKDIQHDESEIKLGEVENENASLSGTGGLVIPVEPVTTTYLRPKVFEDKNSNRSSSSLSSEVDEKSSDLRKDGPKIFEPFETEVQIMSGMVDDTHHKEPVYDASPLGSAKVLSFSSISFDLQAEVSEVVTVPSSAEMRVPSVDQTLYSDLHSESLKKGTSGNEQIGASSNVHASAENESGFGECNRLFLISSHSDVHDDLPKNLNVKAAFSNSSQSVSLEDKMPAAEKSLSSSSMCNDQPSFDDNNALPESNHGFLEAKQDSSTKDVNVVGVQDPNLKNLLPVSAKSTSSNKAAGVQETTGNDTATEQVSVANELKPSYSKDGSVGRGTNALDSTKEIASSNTETSIQETVANVSPKKLSETNVGEKTQPSNSKDGLLRVETGTKGSTRENALSNTETGVKEPATTPSSLKNVSGDTDPQRPTSSNSKDGSTEVRAKTNSPKQVSEANVREPPKLSNSEDGSTYVNNTEDSTNDIALSSTGSGVLESAKTPVKQVSESDVSKLPKSSKDTASTNTGSGAQETATTVKQVSKSDDSKLPKPLKDELTKAATNDVLSTMSLQETVPNLPKQVSEGNISESPKSSKSKDGTNKEESNAVSSAKEMGSNTLGTGVQETVSTRTPTKKLSEVNVENPPKPSDSKDEHKEIETNAVSSVTEASKNTKSGVQEKVTTDQRQVSEGNSSELPKASNSKDVSLEVATGTAAGSKSVQETVAARLKQVSECNHSEAPKPSNLKGGSTDAGTNAAGSTQSVLGTATTLKQVSQGDVSELPKPSNSKNGSTEVANAVDPTKSVQDTTNNQEVYETNVSELPKTSKVGSTEVDTNYVVDSIKKLAPSNMGTGVQESTSAHTEGKVAEDNVGELPKPSSSTAEMPKVEVDAVGTTKDIPSSNTESDVQKSAITSEAEVAVPRPNSEGHAGEVLKPSISEESSTDELPKLTNPKESNAAESQKPPESKGWLWW